MGWVDQVPRARKLFIGGLHALYQKPDLYVIKRWRAQSQFLASVWQALESYAEYCTHDSRFKQAGITHILSVLDFDIYEAGHFKEYTHLHIRIDDHPDENLLQYFNETNKFIDDALNSDGGVFVHCAMGKSRSATVCCAYLMRKYNTSPYKALSQICEGRPVCSPNAGFMEQLEIYSHMLKAKDEEESKQIYQKWLKEREPGDWWSGWYKRYRL